MDVYNSTTDEWIAIDEDTTEEKFLSLINADELAFDFKALEQGSSIEIKIVNPLESVTVAPDTMGEELITLTNLTSLDLSIGNIYDKDLKYLPNLQNLTSLRLYRNMEITNEGLKLLPNLTSLDLILDHSITDEGITHLKNLTQLNLSENYLITDEGLNQTDLQNLTSLNLCADESITDKGLIQSNLQNLTSLNLTCNETITNEGLKLCSLPNLKYLSLKDNDTITDEKFKELPPIEVESSDDGCDDISEDNKSIAYLI